MNSDDFGIALAFISVVIGGAGALSCAAVGQLYDDARGLWLSAGLMVYSAVGIPAATITAHTEFGIGPLGNVRTAAHLLFIALTFAAAFLTRRPARDGWTVLYASVAMISAAGAVGVRYPEASEAVTSAQPVRVVVAVVWFGSAVSIVSMARSRRSPWLMFVGVGFAVIALAHALRAVAASPDQPSSLVISTLRLLGLVLVSAGTVPAARRALRESFQVRMNQQIQLADAHTDLKEIAERDHELRNSMNMLTSAAVLLDSDLAEDEEQTVLRAAVADELVRLNGLLQPRAADEANPAREFNVLAVVRHRITLAASTGMHIRMIESEPGLRACGNPLVFAQVITTVLTNCARHAHGSPVQVSVTRRSDSVMLRITDFGPGVPADLAADVFERGVRSIDSPGQGFGLYLSRRLLATEGGHISLAPRAASSVGCTILIEIPAADDNWRPRATPVDTGTGGPGPAETS